ncbi:MAG: L-threonylcarbamoyladenylate synthase [Candidatus Levyibacteriota bacterium]
MNNLNLKKAIKILKRGGIVIFPTDTAFGIGCRIDNEKAVKRLFKLRKRSKDKAVPVLVESIEMAKDYLEDIPISVLEKLINPFWPGALTIILKCNKIKVPSLVRGGKNTLGVRMPKNKLILDLIKGVGVPVLGPSANFSHKKTPFRIKEIDKELIKLTDFVLLDQCNGKKPSTVIDCSKEPWEILRRGAVDINKKVEKNVILTIDTSTKEIKAGLIVNGKKFKINKSVQKAQVVLPLIEEILRKHKISIKNVSKIRVNTGPGSFTGLRVGISIANTLGKLLNIPINDKKIGELEEPKYK